METASGPIVIVKLKAGWVFDVDAGVARRRGEQVQLLLPPGARLRPALPLPPQRHRTRGERELQRYLHLLPPPEMDGEAALALVRDWRFVESAELVSTA